VSDKVYLTEEGVKKLEAELHDLKYNIRPKISEKVNEARELGDLKENAEYHAARESLSMAQTRIQQLQDTLARSEIVKAENLDKDTIHILSTVKLKNLKLNKTVTYTLVSQEETDLKSGKISISSPVGKGLIGHKVGDRIDVQVPAGKLEFEVLEISQ
jgi:transcription elongation factor GreA